ncbi:M28 family peptidase [Baaleninema simplex]|uniref:M28 family peptidase n=2 Tax=Baaleninema simplex TaxID=2862350 RepID=UPI001181B126|nr:M28 family peptidase [Baaleninema simplex]
MPRVFRVSLAIVGFWTVVLLGCTRIHDPLTVSLPDLATGGRVLGAIASTVSHTVASENAVEMPQIDGDRLFRHVEALAFPRNDRRDRRRVRQYLLNALREAGWSPELRAFDGGANVVATQAGTDPDAGTVLVGAHYDTVADSPGADDNASGVATLLELARVLRSNTHQRRLTLVLFDREEDGLLGSLNFVAPETTADLQGAIVLEMTGYACYEVGCQTYPSGLGRDFPKTGTFLAVVGNVAAAESIAAFSERREADRRGTDLPDVETLTVPFDGVVFPDLLRSDHAPFWLAGLPAVMVTDTANFRNPNYHRPSDTPETLDRAFFTGSAQLVVNATATLLEPETLASRSRVQFP